MLSDLRRQDGFSLLEFIIYISIFVVSSTFLAAILVTVTKVQIRQTAVNEVNYQTNFVTNTLQRLIRESSAVDIPVGVSTSTLVLRTASSATDPTLVYASGSVIYLREAVSAPVSLTDTTVSVDSFAVTKFESGGQALTQVDLAIRYNTSASQSIFQRAVQTAVTRVTAATFDSDLIPGTDNAFNLGVPTASWKNAYFSGNVGIGTTNPNSIFEVTGLKSGDFAGRFTNTGTDSADGGLMVETKSVNPNARALDVRNNGTTSFVIKGDGNVGIGTTGPSYKLQVIGDVKIGNGTGEKNLFLDSGSGNVYFTSRTTGGNFLEQGIGGFNTWIIDSNYDMYFGKSGGMPLLLVVKSTTGRVGIGTAGPNYKLELANCGGACAGKPDGVSWTDTSDTRLKNILGFYSRGLKEILVINPVIFQYKKGNPLNLPSGIKRTGLIAQEVRKVIPEAVFEGEDGYLRLNSDPVFWAMLNAIKEQQEEIENLRIRLEKMELEVAN